MRSVTRSVTLPTPVTSTRALTEIAAFLATGAVDEEGERDVTLLAVSVSHLRRAGGLQLALPFEGGDGGAARWSLDRSVDAVRARFGRGSVGYAPVVLGGEGMVPDDFRELAERDLTEAGREE
jgi:DNA polymerase-4